MFIDTADHAFTEILESNWRAIRAEFEALVPDDFQAWPEKYLCEEGWDVFGLWGYGSRLDDNCDRCPVTAKIGDSIPGLTTMAFSILQKHSEIAPHHGFTDRQYVGHLGLVVPENCGIQVGGETRNWEEGKFLIFNDWCTHSVWNRSDSARVVLLIDFLRDPNSEADQRAVAAVREILQQRFTRST